jgi:CO/xanthine dehydrogenase Mo-binding subunit
VIETQCPGTLPNPPLDRFAGKASVLVQNDGLHAVECQHEPNQVGMSLGCNVDVCNETVAKTKFAIGVDCGKIINPRQLDRCMKSGVVMGQKRSRKGHL